MFLSTTTSFSDRPQTSIRAPEIIGIGGLLVGFILAFFRKPYFFYQDALYGIFLLGGILFVITFGCQKLLGKEIIGYNDITLLCMIGAFYGLRGALFSLVAGSLLGALIGIPIMMAKDKGMGYSIPFGPFLSLGTLSFIFFGGPYYLSIPQIIIRNFLINIEI